MAQLTFVLYFFFLKFGIKKTKQATKKNRLPNIAQKFPILDIINPIAEIIKSTHPIMLIVSFFIFSIY